jgi:hypothetical protein
MWKLLAAAIVVGGLAAFAHLVPLDGRTLAERWRAAPDAVTFANRSWDELASRRAPAAPEKPARRAQPSQRPQAARPAARPAPAARAEPARPVEQHRDEDRAALDRLLAEHAK